MCVYGHIPVLANEILGLLQPSNGKVFIDATLGLGGHTSLLLKTGATVYGIDADRRNLDQARELLTKFCAENDLDFGAKMHFINDNFEHLEEVAQSVLKKEKRLDGILFDLGISSVHVDDPARGFSFMREGPLDMRLNPDQKLTAADIINTYSEKDLKEILETYGDESFAHRIAYNIVQYRSQKAFETTVELADFIAGVVHSRNGFYAKRALATGEWPAKEREHMHEWALRQRRHPATRTFQAVRMAVNREVEVLNAGITQALNAVSSGGRVVVITFHSLEDRLVKNIFKSSALTKEYGLLTKKPIEPTSEEMSQNPRSRSAKVRGIERRDSHSNT